jgi:hypothetical protein
MRPLIVAAGLMLAPIAIADPAAPPTLPTPTAVTVQPPTPDSAPAPAPAPAPPIDPAQAAAAAKAKKLVCKPNIPPGTRIAKGRTCMTQEEWDYISQSHQKRFDDAQQRTFGGRSS